MEFLRRIARSPLMRGLTLYLVVPNLAFFVLGRYFFIDRVYVNTDYLLLWALSFGLPRVAVCVLYALLLDLDLVLSTDAIYHFTTAETMALGRELLEHKPLEFYAIAAGLLLVAGVALFIVWRSGGRRSGLSGRAHIAIGIVALLSAAASAFHLTSGGKDNSLDLFAKNAVVGSAIAETSLAGRWADETTREVSDETAAAMMSIANAGAGKNAPAPYDILYILVEAQGLLKSTADMSANLAPLLGAEIRARYNVSQGTVRFEGGTMFGELRALCRIYAPQTTPERLPGLEHCLPNLLRARGYDTVSYHGYWRWFYQRQDWYPKLGFARSHFAEDLLPGAPESAHCGTMFPGACDLWIADRIEDELARAGKLRKFVYWVTLNSHYPVESSMAEGSTFDCSRTETLKKGTDPCDLARIHFQLYERIARMALDPAIPPTRIIIVGDHMPPFPGLSERALYDDQHVPYIDLMPK